MHYIGLLPVFRQKAFPTRKYDNLLEKFAEVDVFFCEKTIVWYVCT